MIFSNNFVTMELIQKNQTLDNSTVSIKIKRNSQYYYNLRGMVLRIRSQQLNIDKRPYVWYTKERWNGITGTESNLMPAPSIDGIQESITNVFEYEEEFDLPNVRRGVTYRNGAADLEITLEENGTDRVLLKGLINMSTLNTALPRIYGMNVSIERVNKIDYLVTRTSGNNPNKLYDLKLYSDLFGIMDEFTDPDATTSSVEHRQQIMDAWRGQTYTTTFSFLLSNNVITSQEVTFRIPSDELGMFLLDERRVWLKADRAWIKTGNQDVPGGWEEISAAWSLVNEVFMTRE